MLDATLAGLPADWPVIAVGEQRRTERAVIWARESPEYSGPLAAVAAALPLVDTMSFALVGGDMPYAGPSVPLLLHRLAASAAEVGAAVGVDPQGRRQPLLAAYRTDQVRSAMPSDAADQPMRRLLSVLRVVGVELPEQAAHDIDAPADLPGHGVSSRDDTRGVG